MDEITFSEFKKIDLRVGKIIKAEKIEGKDKLYKLQVDLGNCQRTLVAGIAKYYSLEELVGKEIVVVKNLKPAKIAGIVSEGMLLAAGSINSDMAVLVSPEKEVAPGTEIS